MPGNSGARIRDLGRSARGLAFLARGTYMISHARTGLCFQFCPGLAGQEGRYRRLFGVNRDLSTRSTFVLFPAWVSMMFPF